MAKNCEEYCEKREAVAKGKGRKLQRGTECAFILENLAVGDPLYSEIS